MKKLTQKDVNLMTKEERNTELDRLEDLMCNTDYRTSEGRIVYDLLAWNSELIISKKFGEF